MIVQQAFAHAVGVIASAAEAVVVEDRSERTQAEESIAQRVIPGLPGSVSDTIGPFVPAHTLPSLDSSRRAPGCTA